MTSSPTDVSRSGSCAAKAGLASRSGRDEQDVDRAGPDVGQHLRPGVEVGGVDGRGAQPGPLGRGDLVAHERQQRRHHQRRPGALRAQRGRRGPVDRRLAPAGGLHDEHPAVPLDQLLHRPHLVGPRAGVGAGHRRDHPLEDCGRAARRHRAHASILVALRRTSRRGGHPVDGPASAAPWTAARCGRAAPVNSPRTCRAGRPGPSGPGESPSVTDNDTQGPAKVAELVSDIKFAMLTTVDADGELVSRPMAHQEVEADSDLWFFSSRDSRKVEHVRANPHVAVTLASSSTLGLDQRLRLGGRGRPEGQGPVVGRHGGLVPAGSRGRLRSSSSR